MEGCNSDMRTFPKIAPPYQGKTRILVPSGIGDIYWILVKLKSFCRKYGIDDHPEIYIMSLRVWDDSNRRSEPFLKMVPFIDVPVDLLSPAVPSGSDEQKLNLFYHQLSQFPDNRIVPGFFGYEYLVCFNGIINSGHYLEEIDPDLECDWYFSMTISQEQTDFQNKCKKDFGSYAVFYFSFMGDFVTQNLSHFKIKKLAASINRLSEESGITPVFVGSWWDLRWPEPPIGHIDYLPLLIDRVPGAVNLVGQTTLDQVFGVLRGADLVSGYHCGLTNMAIAFKRPTVLLWSEKRFPPKTPLAVASPDSRNTWYRPLFTDTLTIDGYVGTMKEVLNA
jgi:hypothetical protein